MTSAAVQQSKNEVWILVATVLASGMAFIDATALNVALPAIQSQMDATGADLLWIVNAYAVVTAALLLFGGALGDRFGRVGVFSTGISLFVVASLCCGAARSVPVLVIARAFQGLGAALMIPGSLSLISTVFEPSRRGRAIGIWSACSVVMTALGPIMGGWFADAGFWRAIFWVNLPIGAVSLWVLFRKVSLGHDAKPKGSIDYIGAGLSILALASLNYGLIEMAVRGWSDPTVATAFAVSLVSGFAFIANEARSPCPLLRLGLFRNRNFVAACQLTICFYSGLYGMLFFLALNLIQVQEYSAANAGIAQLPVMLLVIMVSPIAGMLVDRQGPRGPLTVGGILAVLGFLLLARPGLTSGVSAYWRNFLPPLVLLGLAMGLTAAPLSTTIMNSVPKHDVGSASGLNSTLSRLSAVLGIALLGPLAIWTFSRSLMVQTKGFSLSSKMADALQQQSWRLADAMAPAGTSLEVSMAVEQAVRLAYVDAFRAVAYVAAAVVGVSTLLSAAMLKHQSDH